MKKVYLLLALGLLIPLCVNAQTPNLQNNNWVFGIDAITGGANHLRFFPSGSVTPAISTATVTAPGYTSEEGCASVSDRLGNLAMFSDGRHIWVPDLSNPGSSIEITGPGTFLEGNVSSAQNVIFVPRPNHAKQYYVVTISGKTPANVPPRRGLHFSLVDLENNSVTSPKPLHDHLGVPIGPAYLNNSEAVTSVIHSANNSYWVVAYIQQNGIHSGRIYSYLVTEDGIGVAPITGNHQPIRSHIITIASATSSYCIKVSPNTQFIAMANNLQGIILRNFDFATGIVSNRTPAYPAINTDFSSYALEFSPNSAFIYYTRNNNRIVRYDIAANTSTVDPNILGKKFTPQRGPDDAIYISNDNANSLTVVGAPNSATPTMITGSQPVSFFSWRGLPQWVYKQECEPILVDNDDIPANYKTVREQRSDHIEATNRVNVDARLLYHAQNFIELLPTTNSLTDIGFEAVYGSEFEADIKPCGTPFSYRLSSGTSPDDESEVKSQPSGIINVYPNPTNKFITISYGDALLKTVSIYSMDGKLMLVQQVNSNSNEADVSGYAKGVYLISAETADGKILKSKFVKN